MSDKTVTITEPHDLSLAEKTKLYLDFIRGQKLALEQKFRDELEALSKCERLYEGWLSEQVQQDVCVIEVKPDVYEMLT
jgi:hypothetical protein